MKILILLERILKYTASSAAAFSLDLLLLYLFVEFIGLFYLLAAGISFAIAHSMNYFIQRNWGFRGTTSGMWEGYMYFVCFGLISALLTLFLLAVAVENFGINYLIGRIIVAFAVGLINFVLNYSITFKMSKELSNKKSKHI